MNSAQEAWIADRIQDSAAAMSALYARLSPAMRRALGVAPLPNVDQQIKAAINGVRPDLIPFLMEGDADHLLVGTSAWSYAVLDAATTSYRARFASSPVKSAAARLTIDLPTRLLQESARADRMAWTGAFVSQKEDRFQNFFYDSNGEETGVPFTDGMDAPTWAILTADGVSRQTEGPYSGSVFAMTLEALRLPIPFVFNPRLEGRSRALFSGGANGSPRIFLPLPSDVQMADCRRVARYGIASF